MPLPYMEVIYKTELSRGVVRIVVIRNAYGNLAQEALAQVDLIPASAPVRRRGNIHPQGHRAGRAEDRSGKTGEGGAHRPGAVGSGNGKDRAGNQGRSKVQGQWHYSEPAGKRGRCGAQGSSDM